MRRLFLRLFAVLAYLAFLGSIGAFIARVLVLLPERAPESAASALGLDIGWVLLFALSHSLMARPSFKRWWTQVIPVAAERSIYVFTASVFLGLLTWQWRPAAGPRLWNLSEHAEWLMRGVQLTGFTFAMISTFLIDYFGLYGLRQAFEASPTDDTFRTPLFYRVVRHPQYLGLLIGFWAMPSPSLDRLALAGGLTAYILFAVRLEERALLTAFGDVYRQYQQEVPMLLPLGRSRSQR